MYSHGYIFYVFKLYKINITNRYYIGFVLYYDVLLNIFLSFLIYCVMKIYCIMDIFFRIKYKIYLIYYNNF